MEGYHHWLASSIAAVVTRSITHPLDAVRIRYQVHSAPSLRSVLTGSLYRGFGISLLLSAPATTAYLATYDHIKASLTRQSTNFSSTVIIPVSAMTAEIVSGCIWTPMEVVKSRLVVAPNSQSTLSLVRDIFQESGLPGFFRGYFLTLLVFVPHSIAYFSVYEVVKEDMTSTSLLSYSFASAYASACASLVSAPLDIVKTRWQVNKTTVNLWEMILRMYRLENGWRAFYKGSGTRMLWMAPSAAISMGIYEVLKQQFEQFYKK